MKIILAFFLFTFTLLGQYNIPTSQYRAQYIQGWKVYFNTKVPNNTKMKVVSILNRELSDFKRRSGGKAGLRSVKIWVGVDDSNRWAEYHFSKTWLLANKRNPNKAKSIEFGKAAKFPSGIKSIPSVVFHELAHAKHDKVGTENRQIIDMWQRYRHNLSSVVVKRSNNTNDSAALEYAASNKREFFAELSCVYFGKHRYWKSIKNRQIISLMDKVWGRTNRRITEPNQKLPNNTKLRQLLRLRRTL